MKTTCLLVISYCFLAIGFCHAQKSEYKTDSVTGIKYLFFKHAEKGGSPSMGDNASVVIVYKTQSDSLLFDSHAGKPDSTGVLHISLSNPFHGSLEQGITMMRTGDSASFIISADSIYFKAFKLKALPVYIKPGSFLKFYVKLVLFQTLAEIKEKRQKQIDKARSELDTLERKEAGMIKKYLKDSNIHVKSSIVDSFYVLKRSGKIGKPILDGDSVEVKYKGMLLDGSVFDQSDPIHGHATFTFQYSHQAKLIRGWIEVLATMHEGEKVTALFPSSMAYGSNQAGKTINPYSPLIFEIEVVKVKPFN